MKSFINQKKKSIFGGTGIYIWMVLGNYFDFLYYLGGFLVSL